MPEVILFEHINFRGAHKHVFWAEPNLHAPDDSQFADLTSSIVVVSGLWAFYRDVNFNFVEGILGPGIYPWVEAVNITNDSISSLQPLAFLQQETQEELLRNLSEKGRAPLPQPPGE
jgi:hypothetical protein